MEKIKEKIFFDHEKLFVYQRTLECASGLDIQYIKNTISKEELHKGKSLLKEVVSMIVGLIKNNSSDRVYDSSVEYKVGEEKEDELD